MTFFMKSIMKSNRAHVIAALAAAWVYSVQAWAIDPSTAFEQGKTMAESYKDINKQKNVIDNAPNTIPGYTTTRPEENFYGMEGLTSPATSHMNSCAANPIQDGTVPNHMECEAVNFLAKRPSLQSKNAFPNIENDPAALFGAYVSGNINDIASQFGFGQNGLNQCTTVTITDPAQYVDKHCIEGYPVEARSCTYGREIVIDADTNYQCNRTVNAYETFDCRRKSSVTCTGGGTGCAPAGISTNSIGITGFGRYLVHPAGGGYWFVSAGTIAPDGSYINNYDFGGKFYNVFTSNIQFNVTNTSKIATFYLNEILYDDNIAVWLNGHLIFHSTGGYDLIRRETCVDDGVRCSSGYYSGGAKIRGYGGVELKGLLVEGRNTITIKVAIGKNGDAIVRFKTLAYCPLNCSVSTNNECAALEARAQ